MTGALTLARGLWHRAGTSLVIFVVALCATAAAAIGPTYYTAARDSILQDTLQTTATVGRAYQASQTGGVSGTFGEFSSRVDKVALDALGSRADERRLFAPPIQAIETTAFFSKIVVNTLLVWRSDVCAHLRLRSGHCPTATNDVMVSRSLADVYHWRVGQTVHPAGRRPLRVAAIYQPPQAPSDYWFARGSLYFPAEFPSAGGRGPTYDALFTPRSTIEALTGNPQGTLSVSRLLRVPNVTPGDIDRLSHAADRLGSSPALLNSQTVVITSIPGTMSGIHASWGKLAVPVVVVTAELLVLTWLLLFLVVTDAVEARGTEIALAKLRGYGAVRAMVFGLGEPAALLAVSLPVGTLVGWALTAVLSHVLLRDGTPVPLPGLGWAAALVAVLGGVAAVVAAGRRTVVRPVVEQWRRTGRRATHRGWVFDAVVLTAAVAGLVQLYATGTFRSASSSALAMLVPGLLGLAIAVVASRLLPAACRALFRRTRTGGELGSFLAVRHIARRPGGTRTTMILATALALATFSLSAWMVGESNRTRLAQVGVGAPTVLTVAPDPGVDLAKVVDRIDPQGKTAAAVVSYDNGQATLFGVQPRRFARVAHWSAGEVQDPQRLLGGLHPPASDPIILDGDRVRLHFTDVHLSTGPAAAVIELSATGALAPTPVEMGTLHSGGPQTLSGDLSACPCYLSDLQIGPIGGGRTVTAGRVTLTGIDVQRSGTWQRVPRIGGPQQWGDTVDQRVHVQGNGDSVTWRFFAPAINAATLRVLDRPDPLPAVVSAALDRPNSEIPVSGLDAGDLHVTPVADVLGVPGAPSDGVVVDLDYAVRAAAGATAPATQQVWVRGDAGRISDALRKAGIPLLGAVSSHTEVERVSRQGPGLASVLFLADAAAAAVLAALAAILSLSAAARRRRYEYAALSAAGASRRTLYAALAIEQVAVIGFGAVTGIGAGLLATAVAGRNVPEFVNPLHSPLLRYLPSPVLMSVVLGAGLVLLVAIAAVAAAALLRSVTPDQLREAPT